MDFDFDFETITPITQTTLTIVGTGSLLVPSGTTAERPSVPVNGMLRYNTDLTRIDMRVAGAWQNIQNQSSALDNWTTFAGNGANTGVIVLTAADTFVNRTITGTNNTITLTNGSGVAGNPTITIADNPIFPGTASQTMVTGTTAQRPGGSANGMTRYNTTLANFEAYKDAWYSVLRDTHKLYANQVVSPNTSDWPISAAASLAPDPSRTSTPIRAFDDTTAEGISFMLSVPAFATNLTITIRARRSSGAGAAGVVMSLYSRDHPNNAAVAAWSAATALTTFTVLTNTNYAYYTQTISLATLGVTAGNLYNWELTRTPTAGGDTLTVDWYVAEVIMEFS